MKEFLKNIWETVETIVIAGVVVLVIRTYVVQPFLVSGASMEPNFSGGHYLLIDEVTYRFWDPQRGDVIVFRYPGDNKTFYIKRIIGLPKDRIVISDGQVKINDESLEEGYIDNNVKTLGNIDRILEKDEYFALGDNRYYSFDSRQWGVLPKKNIVGLVRLRLFPLNRLALFQAPTY